VLILIFLVICPLLWQDIGIQPQGATMKKLIWILSMMFMLSLGFIAPVIADCPDSPMSCWGPPMDQGGARIYCGNITIGTCYDWKSAACVPCDLTSDNPHRDCGRYNNQCNSSFPNCCKGDCWPAYKYWDGSICCGAEGWKPPYWP